jgi:two-component system invasion response regulator UvrY
MKPIKIIIADDHKLVRESWSILLNQTPGLEVVAQCNNGNDAVTKANELHPDIMLIDITMSSNNGIETTQAMIRELPDIKIIGISISNQPHVAIKVMNAGAKGFVTKSSSLTEIINAIQEVHKGGSYLCEEIRKRIN